MNLINDPWIPVRHLNGGPNLITPWQITEHHNTNPIITLDAPRPDFNGALAQFLIGLLQTTTAIKYKHEWGRVSQNPPSPEELREQFLNEASNPKTRSKYARMILPPKQSQRDLVAS